jgi:hypothetical protein
MKELNMQNKAIYGLILASMIGGTALAGGPDMIPTPTPWHLFIGANYSYLKADVTTSGDAFYYNNTVIAGGTTGSITTGTIPSVADKYNGIGMLAGLKYGKYVGLVWGWNHYFVKGKKSSDGTLTIPDATLGTLTVDTAAETCTKPENFYFDVRGYLPFDNFDLIASVGANVSDFSTEVTYPTTVAQPASYYNITNINFRAGVGADYYFTPNWGIEGMWNWVFQHAPGKVGSAPSWLADTEREVGIPCSFWTINVGINYMFD